MSHWWILRKAQVIANLATPAILSLLEWLRVIKWNSDVSLIKSPRGKVLWEEAIARGMTVRNLVVFGRQLDAYEASRSESRFFYTGVPTGDITDKDAIWWMDDKSAFKKKLEPLGIPIARGGSFSRWRPLRKRFSSLTLPVIIKPRLGSRGRHTTTMISTEAELRDAFRIAKQLGRHVIMEEHLFGSVYRGTVIEGKVVAVLRGDPPKIVGDGIHTIKELVDAKNANRDTCVGEVILTKEHIDFLARNGYSPETVLSKCCSIDVLSKVGLSVGGSSVEMTPVIHPKVITALEHAAAMIDYPVIGFDFIIEDPTTDPDVQRWGIIEANSAPFINIHHNPLEGKPVNVAAYVWDMVERKRF